MPVPWLQEHPVLGPRADAHPGNWGGPDGTHGFLHSQGPMMASPRISGPSSLDTMSPAPGQRVARPGDPQASSAMLSSQSITVLGSALILWATSANCLERSMGARELQGPADLRTCPLAVSKMRKLSWNQGGHMSPSGSTELPTCTPLEVGQAPQRLPKSCLALAAEDSCVSL